MRNYLTNLNIYGATLIARGGKLLEDYTIPNLLKHCNKVLLMQDNTNEETRNIALKFKEKYPESIILSETGFPPATKEQEDSPRKLLRRFKKYQGPCRERVFEEIRKENKKQKIDILLFPDSDEIWRNEFGVELEKFWNSEYKGWNIKPIDIYCDFKTCLGRSMFHHMRAMKWDDKINANPYHTQCQFNGIKRTEKFASIFDTIHLCYLTKEKIEFRKKHWKFPVKDTEPLWTLPKDIREMSTEEIKKELERPSDTTVGEYNLKHGINL